MSATFCSCRLVWNKLPRSTARSPAPIIKARPLAAMVLIAPRCQERPAERRDLKNMNADRQRERGADGLFELEALSFDSGWGWEKPSR